VRYRYHSKVWVRFPIRYIFIRSERAARKKTNNKKQQQTNINKADRQSYHMTCYLRVSTEESVLKKILEVIDIVDLTPILKKVFFTP